MQSDASIFLSGGNSTQIAIMQISERVSSIDADAILSFSTHSEVHVN